MTEGQRGGDEKAVSDTRLLSEEQLDIFHRLGRSKPLKDSPLSHWKEAVEERRDAIVKMEGHIAALTERFKSTDESYFSMQERAYAAEIKVEEQAREIERLKARDAFGLHTACDTLEESLCNGLVNADAKVAALTQQLEEARKALEIASKAMDEHRCGFGSCYVCRAKKTVLAALSSAPAAQPEAPATLSEQAKNRRPKSVPV